MTISQAQTLAKTYSGSGTTGTATFASGVTSGNLLVAKIMVGSGNITYTTPTGWTAGPQALNTLAGGISIALFYCIVGTGNSFGGTTAFAFVWSSSHSFGIEIEEWNSSTGWQASPLDKSSSTFDTVASTAMDSGTTSTTTQATELWQGALAYKAGLQTLTGVTSGWTTTDNTANGTSNSQACFNQVVSATGAARVQATLATTAEVSAGVVATFLPVSTTTSTRTVPASVALQTTLTRTVTASVALQTTLTRTVTASAALQTTLTRTITASTALQTTLTRTVSATTALQSLGLKRTIPSTVALQSLGLTRTVLVSAALLTTLQRVVPSSAAMLTTNTRTVPASVALFVALALPTVSTTATVRDGLAVATVRDGLVSAVMRDGKVTVTVRDGSVQTLCRDGTIVTIVR